MRAHFRNCIRFFGLCIGLYIFRFIISGFQKANYHILLKEGAHNDDGGCRFPEIDPFAPKYKNLFYKVKRPTCTKLSPVTHLQEFENSTVIVTEKVVAIEQYHAVSDYKCCYREIYRQDSPDSMRDQEIKTSECFPMGTFTTLPETTEFITVTCENQLGDEDTQVFYKNGHALVPDKKIVQERFALNPQTSNSAVSILMIGIDSMSSTNLKRAMPETAKYLHMNEWIEYQGYNKIGDDSYSNLMAILAGYNSSDAYSICKPITKLGLSDCSLIWDNFKSRGYVTAYGEDSPDISTFNFMKKGFHEQPTDYYMRPFFLALQKHMPPRRENNILKQICTGPVTAALRIYGYAAAFAAKYRNDPFFALFWLNSFSHGDINLPSAMDKTTKVYFMSLEDSGVLDTSIVFFFSNYGLPYEFGKKVTSSFYEERLPFFYAWFPEWFRNRYPNLVQNFRDNAKRLTNPYDFHVTLRHLLSLHDPTSGVEPGTRGCPKCDSLLNPISPLRTCKDASIDQSKCACMKTK